mmetsp:Transcript_61102/g.189263  ORF Transcript_61102/g.189263 Transcript_61102/m.189263 type:complete len:200 (-) Transcript_61102:869-1468(-)
MLTDSDGMSTPQRQMAAAQAQTQASRPACPPACQPRLPCPLPWSPGSRPHRRPARHCWPSPLPHHGWCFSGCHVAPLPSARLRTNWSVSTGPQHSSPLCNLMRYGLPSSQSAMTCPASQPSQFASTASPTLKRSGATLQLMTPSSRKRRSNLRPMKTRRHSRASPCLQRNLGSNRPLKSMCTPWKTNLLGIPFTASTPL